MPRRVTGRIRNSRVGVTAAVLVAAVAAMTLGLATAAAAPSPQCPSGATYNKKTKVCEQPKEQQCPSGSTLSGGKCVKGVTFVCPSETTLQPDGTCTAPPPTCRDGYLPVSGDSCSGPITCPEGFTVTSEGCRNLTINETVEGTCPENYERSRPDTCVGQAQRGCPNFTTYNGQCSANPKPTCESPFTLNVSTGLCEATPTAACPTGTSENTSTGLCESAPTKGSGGGGGGRPKP